MAALVTFLNSLVEELGGAAGAAAAPGLVPVRVEIDLPARFQITGGAVHMTLPGSGGKARALGRIHVVLTPRDEEETAR